MLVKKAMADSNAEEIILLEESPLATTIHSPVLTIINRLKNDLIEDDLKSHRLFRSLEVFPSLAESVTAFPSIYHSFSRHPRF